MRSLSAVVAVADTALEEEVQRCLSGLPVQVALRLRDLSQWGEVLAGVERAQPDVVILELGPIEPQLENALQQLRRTRSAPAVILVHTAPDADMILRAMRAGAAEYLVPPVETGLRTALERIAADRRREGKEGDQGTTVAVFGAKGGCGVTTVACHLAVELQTCTSKQVLLADFDLESGIIGFLLKSKSPYSVADAIYNVNRLDLSYWKALVSNGIPGLEVIKAPAPALARPDASEEPLRRILRFARPYYQWLVADLGRNQNLGALEEADKAVLVTTIDVPALHQAKHIIRMLRETGYGAERLHIVLNRVPKRTDVTTEEIRGLLGVEVAAALPEDSTALYEAYADGKLLSPAAEVRKRIGQLAAKLAGVAPEKPKRKGFLF